MLKEIWNIEHEIFLIRISLYFNPTGACLGTVLIVTRYSAQISAHCATKCELRLHNKLQVILHAV